MAEPEPLTPEWILRRVAEASPQPFYPAGFARDGGHERARLDEPLERLRLAGLLRLTEWQAGVGQGYLLTDTGREALDRPRRLAAALNGPIRPIADDAPPESRRPSNRWERGEAAREALLRPTGPPRVTQALIAINVVVFLVGMAIAVRNGTPANKFLATGDAAALHATGAVTGGDLLDGGWEWGRLLTCCFVHFGGLHLFMNMFSLYMIGPLVEQLWGRWRYLALYLLAGLGGTCVAMLSEPAVLLAGASGAIWGLMASMLAWLGLNRAHLPPALVTGWLRQLLLVFAVNIYLSFQAGISKEAHFGGGAVGILAATLLHLEQFATGAVRIAAILALLAGPLLGVAAVRASMDTNPKWQKAAQRRDARAIQAMLPLVQSLSREARTLSQTTDKLLEEAPAARDPTKVTAAVVQSESLRDRLAEAEARLDRAGPFRSDELGAVATKLRTYLTAERSYWVQVAKQLRAGPDGFPQERLEFLQQRIAREAAERDWQDELETPAR